MKDTQTEGIGGFNFAAKIKTLCFHLILIFYFCRHQHIKYNRLNCLFFNIRIKLLSATQKNVIPDPAQNSNKSHLYYSHLACEYSVIVRLKKCSGLEKCQITLNIRVPPIFPGHLV
jgi:hypothetical protein